MQSLDARFFTKVLTPAEAGIDKGKRFRSTAVGTALDHSLWLMKFNTGEEHTEVLSYQLAQKLFHKVVPETYFVTIDGSLGSAQRMVTGESAHATAEKGLQAFYKLMRDETRMMELANMVVMDFMLGSTDRHGHNWFIMENGHLAAIDNGLTSEEGVSFSWSLEPAGRALLVDDIKWTPVFQDLIEEVAQSVGGHSGEVQSLEEELGVPERKRVSAYWEKRSSSILEALKPWRKNMKLKAEGRLG